MPEPDRNLMEMMIRSKTPSWQKGGEQFSEAFLKMFQMGAEAGMRRAMRGKEIVGKMGAERIMEGDITVPGAEVPIPAGGEVFEDWGTTTLDGRKVRIPGERVPAMGERPPRPATEAERISLAEKAIRGEELGPGVKVTPAAVAARTGFIRATSELAELPLAISAGIKVGDDVPVSTMNQILGSERDIAKAENIAKKQGMNMQRLRNTTLEDVYDRVFGKGNRPRSVKEWEQVVRELQARGATEENYRVVWKRAKVKVKNPQGQEGFIFISDWKEAKRAGYMRIK